MLWVALGAVVAAMMVQVGNVQEAACRFLLTAGYVLCRTHALPLRGARRLAWRVRPDDCVLGFGLAS